MERFVCMIHYSLPDFIKNLRLNLMMIEFMRKSPEVFFDDIEISSIYGSFPGCIMNGGRLIAGNIPCYSYDQIAKTFDAIEKEGLTIRLTLTNILIRPEQYKDEYCQTILKAAEGRNVEVIVNQDELGDYISDRYHFRKILSTTRALDGVEELNRMLGRYDMVVLDYNHNKDDEFLKKVSDPSRLEVMPNELCIPGCKTRQEHYKVVSHNQLIGETWDFQCPNNYDTFGFTKRTESSPTLLSIEDIHNLYQKYGIDSYKLVGRKHSLALLLESYVYYLIRPEYRAIMSKIILKNIDYQKTI